MESLGIMGNEVEWNRWALYYMYVAEEWEMFAHYATRILLKNEKVCPRILLKNGIMFGHFAT
jgi:hypothetical protein